jgi:D-beta-D-heptose 7-phosphate kinase/D-beta-D-heptose 1-phosphate adenosyltransferase
LIRAARAAGKPVVVDPERTDDYQAYRGATCVLPNRFETEQATGRELANEEEYRAAAEELLQELELEAAVVKLDREGMYLATGGGERRHMRIHAQQVADVTGAGDMVAAAMAYALALGADYPLAVTFANFAAGLEVAQVGVTPIGRQTMLDALSADADPAMRKIKDRDALVALRKELDQQGQTVAFTNGCFDLLHLGHTRLIRHARAQADVLIVGMNTDRSVQQLKGPKRPINDQDVRARMLAALEDVDYVVMFDEESVLPLIRELRPDVLVKGGDYAKSEVVGGEFVESYGGRVELAPEVEGFSTTDLINRIAENSG